MYHGVRLLFLNILVLGAVAAPVAYAQTIPPVPTPKVIYTSDPVFTKSPDAPYVGFYPTPAKIYGPGFRLPSPTIPPPCWFGMLFCDKQVDAQYVSTGDSLAFGLFAARGYTYRYQSYIEDTTGLKVNHDALARTGWTSTDMAYALQSNTDLQRAIQDADIVTWNIGGNDLRSARDKYLSGTCGGVDNQECLRHAVIVFRANWNQIVSTINSLTRNTNVIVRTMDIYNPFISEDMASGNAAVLNRYWNMVNAHIHQSAPAVARVAAAFNGPNGNIDPEDLGLISFDGYHPNDRGHEVIAQALHELGYRGLPRRPQPTPTFTAIPPTPTATPDPCLIIWYQRNPDSKCPTPTPTITFQPQI